MLLELSNVRAGYGAVRILHGLSLRLAKGEAIALVGRNGMGKTTTINTIMGICPPRGGTIAFDGVRIDAMPVHRIARRGVGLVPEGRRIFPNLTVRENLLMAARPAPARNTGRNWSYDRVLEVFPRLRERLGNPGNLLSGGEQQMLAIGRALVTNPSLLILDEATEGLAPLIREEIWANLAMLRSDGMSMIVVDKEIEAVCKVVDRQYIIEKGAVAWEGRGSALLEDEALRNRYLSVGEATA
jgi:branched-chain amino acid transport system ATP-binding protein